MRRAQWLRGGLAGGLALFGLLAIDQVLHGPVYALDQPTDALMDRLAGRGWAIHPIGQAMSLAGAAYVDAPLLVVAALLLWSWRERRLALLCLAAGTLNGVLNGVLKGLFQRPLPPFIFDRYPGFAFPSGHTMGVTGTLGVAILLLAEGHIRRRALDARAAHRVRVQATTLWLALALLVGVGRILAQTHWVSDIPAAWAISIALVCGTLLLPWADPTRTGPAPGSPSTGAPLREA